MTPSRDTEPPRPPVDGCPDVSIVLCTHNPDADLIKSALRSVATQDLARERFEVIVVDNASKPPLDLASVNPDPTLRIHLVNEARPGLSIARVAAIQVARAEILVFIDDDNEIGPTYVSTAARIARENPAIGAFGGVSEGVFEGPVPRWKLPLVGYLGVRDYGNAPITSTNAHWGQWDPIGAGMVIRRDVANQYSDFIKDQELAKSLGRCGRALMSGEDTLMARCANQLGYACSYQPELRLRHHIGANRLRASYLRRLIEGHGRSFVTLERVQGRSVAPITGLRGMCFLVGRLLFRVTVQFRTGYFIWHWDLGYSRQSRVTEIGENAA